MRALLVTFALAVLPAAARADLVTVFPALGRPTLVTISGRVVHGSPEKEAGALQRNAYRLLAKSKEGATVLVTFAGRTRKVVSLDDGLFEASFAAPAQAPFPVGIHPVRAEVDGTVGEGRVEVVSDAAPFLVVSDFDDTVAVSNVQSKRGVLTSGLLEDERTQRPVGGMAAFYGCLRDGGDPAPGLAFVTGSPLEYVTRMESFLAKGGFPFAALHLRHLGARTMSGYKEPLIRALLSRFPQRVVLVGDSGEKDPEVYATIRGEFPGRVAAIFIRDVGKSADPARFADMVLFKTAADAARGAAARGLLARECAEHVPSPAPEPASGLRPFATDGCSLFPDRDPIRHLGWRACCVAHDIKYWRGGTEAERLEADEALKACVAHHTGDARLAEVMYRGVRAGGLAEFPTWYRWAYGWGYGRLYSPLTDSERALAEAELAKWKQAPPPRRNPDTSTWR